MYGGDQMEKKPLHYDGSVHIDFMENSDSFNDEDLVITDEARKNIGINPYSLPITDN